MKITLSNTKEATVLLLGDITVFLVSLWLTLTLRYGEAPSDQLFVSHLVPFSFLFGIWVITFFAAGLYDKIGRAHV